MRAVGLLYRFEGVEVRSCYTMRLSQSSDCKDWVKYAE
jgi:hypothetical protein